MIAVRIAPDLRMVVVGSPHYSRGILDRSLRKISPRMTASACVWLRTEVF